MGIILTIAVGTTIADLLAFYIGTLLKKQVDKSKVKMLNWLRENAIGKPKFTAFIVFLWAALSPLPNEVLLLPLGSLGTKLRTVALPFMLGTILYVTGIAYGLSFFT